LKSDAATYRRAARMRRQMTPPEARLWTALKGGRLNGHKFRRQHPAGPYILDFYCAAARLCVEVDGSHHDLPDQLRHDQARDAWLASQGIRVHRVAAIWLRDDPDAVLRGILEVLQGED